MAHAVRVMLSQRRPALLREIDDLSLPSRMMKNPGCRLLKKISEPRRAKNRRAEAYLASTL
jgi:hypothetical protein